MQEPYDLLFKLLLVGDSNVGKTSLLLRFATDADFQEDTRNTIGVDLKVKYKTFGNERLKLTIWDTAGQERFRTLTSSYYRGAHGIILVYDVSDRASFDNVREWLKEVDIYSTNDEAVKMLVGNKIDRGDAREVSSEEGEAFARANNMLYIEASAKTRQGVEMAFDELIQKILDVPSLVNRDGLQQQQQPHRVVPGDDDDDDQGLGCC